MMNTNDIALLQEQHLDMMIKLAFDLEDAETAQRLLDAPDPALTPEEERLADELLTLAYARMDAQKKHSRQHKLAQTARRILPFVVNTAACIILLLAMAAPIALANSATFRSKVMQLLIEIDTEKGEAHFSLVQDDEASFDVPEGWEGYFFPAYLPEGYTIFEYPMEFFATNIGYSNENDSRIYFDEYGDTASRLSGTEGGTIEYVNINGSIGCMIYSETAVTLTWERDGRMLCITAYGLPTEEALQIARSVKRVVK